MISTSNFATVYPFEARLRPSVGGPVPPDTQAEIDQLRAFVEEDVKNSNKTANDALNSHSGYESALAINAAAHEHAIQLRDLIDQTLATVPDLDPGLLQQDKGYAYAVVAALEAQRSSILADRSAHSIHLPPGVFVPPPPVVIPPGPVITPIPVPAGPPADKTGSYILLGVLGLALLYLLPAAGVLLYKKASR